MTLGRLAVPLLVLFFAACTIYSDGSAEESTVGALVDAGDADDGAIVGGVDAATTEPGNDGGPFLSDAGPGGNDGGPFLSDAGPGGNDGGVGFCSTLTNEVDCIASGCGGIFRGSGCSCNQVGMCSCSDYIFLACE